MRYTDVWNDLTEKMGYWVDMENPYVTLQTQIHGDRLVVAKTNLQQRFTIQRLHNPTLFSKSRGTGLSSHEVNQPGSYRDVTDTTIVAQFKAKEETLPSFYKVLERFISLVWTTTLGPCHQTQH